MQIQYVRKRFGADRMRIIDTANDIIAEYRKQKLQLTLRQLYYQFVARDIIENTPRSYKNLGDIINNGRMGGYIDWDAIEDRTRNLEVQASWNNPGELLEIMSRAYHADLWEGQHYYVEVWIEKEALVGVIEDVCQRHDLDYFACRGYMSQSEQHGAAMRIMHKLEREGFREAVILHLGDHDPSGIDMTRDIQDRIKLFLGGEDGLYEGSGYEYPDRFNVRRLALNMDQVRNYNPPPNPAKITDSRAQGYIKKFGRESWELDALEPRVISELISDAVEPMIDWETWDARVEYRDKGREQLKALAKDTNWDEQ